MEKENSNLIPEEISFTSTFKVFKDKGNLVYEYNPFRNYRLSTEMFEYNNTIYSYSELNDEFGIVLLVKKENEEWSNVLSEDVLGTINSSLPIQWVRKIKNGRNLYEKITSISDLPILRRSGELVDFETNELNVDINHPVNIIPQYSYDNSVNLIFNDGKNLPRLINSRFSATERNKYLIVDRKGDNDTNIYDLGIEFDIDTALHKKTKSISELRYNGTFSGGSLSIGNYHFYFKYMDADGNESDFISESGLVSIFIGNTPYNIHSGVRNENSHKGVSFTLTNLDSGYQYISVYYTRGTADIFEQEVVSARKINQKYLINTSNISYIKITGFEDTSEIPIEDINMQYLIFSKADTQEVCLNRLFLGNVGNLEINYKELTDISLRFCPYYKTEKYDIRKIISLEYETLENYNNSYYNSKFIYDKVGYWPGEIYRFGIVYILNDGTLTPVFNVRGIKDLKDDIKLFSKTDFKDRNGERVYISYDEQTNLIVADNEAKTETLENCKGVVKFPDSADDDLKIYSINFELQGDKDIINSLKGLGIRGYFFVRQKRIPTILCLALLIGIDKQSHTPVIPYGGNYIAECFLSKEIKKSPVSIIKDKTVIKLEHEYKNRIYSISNKSLVDKAAICPEYDVDFPYFNSLFSGDTFVISKLRNVSLERLLWNDRFYYENPKSSGLYYTLSPILKEKVRILSVEDNLKLAAIDNTLFSARAGEAEEVFRFEYVSMENKDTEAVNVVRGSFGPFLGLDKCSFESSIINIHIPNYNSGNIQDYFLIRYNDKSSFYAISDRINLLDYKESKSFYRGDCYICLFTHRINRNFLDPAAPTNDEIVDPNCWQDNWKIEDGVIKMDNIDKINLGDVNAIQLGLWVTFIVRSTKNLNVRTLDSSNVDETALFGHPRGFYPYFNISTKGVYKIPEALCYNKGFEKSLSERWNFEAPDVPAIKNDFTNRINYSNIYVTDAFLNGYRTFGGQSYRDYPKTYGSITKLIELSGNLICVFEHGVALIPVNERTVAGEGSGGEVFINTSNVLPENPKIISDTFGSQWRDSVIKTPRGIYGVDTVGKKIWRTNGKEFECISDFRIQEFLNQNISLTERELEPIIGVRNVKTHYNAFKGDVMFTFYDNLYGFEEKVWNVCFNEGLQKWITFYSWVPSYSENIYNLYFSFDRNTSKWITKLGVSKKGNDFSDGVVLTENVIPNDAKSGYKIGDLDLANRTLPSGEGINIIKTYELVPDNFGNWNNFKIENNSLYLQTDAINLCSEFFVRGTKSGSTYTLKITDPKNLKADWINNCVLNSNYVICKDDRGRRVNLPTEPNDKRMNGTSPVILLNIRVNISVEYEGNIPSLGEAYATGFTNKTVVDAGYYQSVVAVIPKYNMQFLTTDFWKHGLAGIIDIADKIYPTYWYGKQHPFEFEFIVADNPLVHKIFDDLEIISNKAEPESFHYEIVGQCYDFSKDKKNMYIRQEATKELYLNNGFDVLYDSDYTNLESVHRPLLNDDGQRVDDLYDKSTLFPLYYSRRDSFNEIEDFYHMKDNVPTKNFSALSGAEIVRYENLDEYRIWNHAKAIDLCGSNRLRGNMLYKEDKWNVLINPLNLVEKNEGDWLDLDENVTKKVPVELGQSPIPNEVLTNPDGTPKSDLTIPDSFKTTRTQEGRGYVVWKWEESQMKEVKLKDKFMKVRIRYSGKNLAIISAIKTMYSASYS